MSSRARRAEPQRRRRASTWCGRLYNWVLGWADFGERAKYVLERYFEWITLLLFAILVGGFLAVRYLLG